jgi:hypothetical protein
MRARTVVASLAALLSLSTLASRAHAVEHLFAAFHLDVDMGTFLQLDERSFGRDVGSGPLFYFDPYFNMWLTGGVQIRPHPMVALDLETGIARWTGVATHSRNSLFSWGLSRVFRARSHFVPLELTVIISVRESPKTFLGIGVGPGFYVVHRYVEAKSGVGDHARALGGGGKLSLMFGIARKGPFEFNLEIGFRVTRFEPFESRGDLPTGDFRPDFSGPFLGLRFLLGGGTSDPAPPEPAAQPAVQPAPQPAVQPAPQPAVQPAPVVPIPPSGG